MDTRKYDVDHPRIHTARSHIQYLAVGPLSSPLHTLTIGTRKTRPCPACIQLWSLSPSTEEAPETQDADPGVMKCEMVLCVESGCAHELRWCPLPSNDSYQVSCEKCAVIAETNKFIAPGWIRWDSPETRHPRWDFRGRIPFIVRRPGP